MSGAPAALPRAPPPAPSRLGERLAALRARMRERRVVVGWAAGLAALAAVTYRRVPDAELPLLLQPFAVLPPPLDALVYVDWALLVLVAVVVGAYRFASDRLAGARARDAARFGLGFVGLLAVVAVLSHRPGGPLVNAAFLSSLMVFVLVYALFALGLNLEFGTAGLVNFGHVAFLSLGAYATVLLSLEAGWSLPAAALGGTLLAGLAGVLLGIPTIKLREDYLAIVTIGAAEVLRLATLNEAWLTGGPRGVIGFPGPVERFRDVPAVGRAAESLGVGEPALVMLLLSLLAVVGAFLALERLVRSPWGRVLMAVREDEELAAALGKNPFAAKLQALALGSALAGLAGALFAWNLRFIDPGMFVATVTFEAWIIVVLGGAGNPKGAVLGAMLFWTFNEATKFLGFYERLGLSEPQGAALRVALIGLLMVLVMRFRPEGLLGNREEMAHAR